MLADWYFCSALRLTMHQTKEYLDISQILRSPHSSTAELHVALERLGQQEDAVRLHALQQVLGCAEVLRQDPSLVEAAMAVWAGLLVGSDDAERRPVADGGSQEVALRHTLADLLSEALVRPSEDFAARVCAALEDVSAPEEPAELHQRVSPPYHDLHEHVLGTVALVLLDRAAAVRPDVVAAAWRNDQRLSSVRAALRGHAGRWPLLLAASALTRLKDAETSRMVRTALAVAGNGAAYLEPDLLAVLASSWFGQPGMGQPDLDLLEAEIARGGLYWGWGRETGGADAKAAVRDRLGVVGKGPDTSLGIALWQLTLWDLATAHHPVETARRTARWWAPPVGGRFAGPGTAGLAVPWARLSEQDDRRAEFWLSRAAALHWQPGPQQDPTPGQRVAAPGESGRDPSAACSPWIERKNDFFRLESELTLKEAADRSRFPTADRPVLLLQLAAVSLLAVRLLRQTGVEEGFEAQRAHDHLVGLLFHTADVFCDPRFLAFLSDLNSGSTVPAELPTQVTPSLAALMGHALATVERAGKGSFAEIRPRLFADFLIDGPGTVGPTGSASPRGPEWRKLFIRPAWNVAHLWIKEAAAGVRRHPSSGFEPDGWYDGENPYARQVLAIGVQRMTELDLHRQPAKPASSQNPFNLTLLREFEGAEVAQRPDWMSELYTPLASGRPRTGIGYETLLFAAPYPLAEWTRHLTRIEELTSKGAALLAMRTVRLAALLDQSSPGAIGDRPEWVEEWWESMAAINGPGQWARSARAFAVGLFGSPEITPDPSTAVHDRLRGVLEVVVDSIVEFSPYAPRYYQLLLERVARAGGLSPEAMNRLRVRTVDAVRRRHDPERLLPVRGGPWAELDAREARQAIETELRLLVQALAETTLAWDARRTLGMVVTDGWRDTIATPPVSLLVTPSAAFSARAGQQAPDPRLVVARVLDRFRGNDQFLVLPQRLTGGPEHEVVDLVGMPVAERKRLLSRWRARSETHWVVGVVCANSVGGPPEGHAEPGDLVLVNWGGPGSLPARSGGTQRRRTGDLCRMEVRWNRLADRWEQVAPILDELTRRSPLPGETRVARVSAPAVGDRMPVRVSVDGEQDQVFAAAGEVPQTAWLRWQPDLSQRWSGTVDAGETMARWDKALACWLPADRTLAELIADDLPYRGKDGCRAAVLVYTGSVVPPTAGMPGGRYFSTRAGRTYLLRLQDWVTGPKDLDGVLKHGPGTLVYVGLRSGARLELLQDPPAGAEHRWPSLARGSRCDLRNAVWLKLFSDTEGEEWEAELIEGRWTVDVSQLPGFPRAVGFPSRVAVRGLDGAPGTRCAFHPEPWQSRVVDAATAVVTGEALSGEPLDDHTRPTWERFEWFWNVPERTVLPVERFLGSRRVDWVTVDALVRGGITVQVDRASLPFARLPSSRRGLPSVEVTRVQQRNGESARPAGPLSDLDFAARLAGEQPARPGPQVRSGALPADHRVRGIVTGILRRDDGTTDRYQVWLDLDGRLLPATLPVSSFTRRHRRTGETFTAVRFPVPGGEWAFVPRISKVFCRALHACTDTQQLPHGGLRFLGRAGARAYYAHPDGGPLVSVPVGGEKGPPTGHGGNVIANLGTGKPVDGTGTCRLLVDDGGTELVGDAPRHGGTEGIVTDVTLQVWRPADGLVALHRSLRVVAQSAAAPDSGADQPVRTLEEELREQLANGETVTLRGRLLGNGTLLAYGLTLPLAVGDAPYVVGSSYGDDAEALLVLSGSALLASTRDAPPRDAARFAAAVTGAPEGTPAPRRSLVQDVYYVGAEQQEAGLVRRFEWGNGLTAVLGPDQITVNDQPCGEERAFPLYHGDRLAALEVRLSADGAVVVDIRSQDVKIQVGHQAYIEADAGIVHQLELAVDPRTGSVVVRKVRLRGAAVGAGQTDYSRKYPVAAELDPDSRERVLAAVRAAPPRTAEDLAGLEILARLDKDAYLRDPRCRRFTYVEARLSAVPAGGVVDQEHVFMVAGAVQSTGNDAFIEFRLPGIPLLPPGQTRPLTVRVRRRQFSSREYLLPQLVAEGRGDYYEDTAVMLVRLQRNPKTRRWSGDLTAPPARDAAALTGAVRQAGGRLLAVLTGEWDKVEVRPGVVYELPQTQGPPHARKAGRGALVVLSEVVGGLRLDLAQDSDRSFVPEDAGRPALVLPKDTLLAASGKGRADDQGQFTVAGLRALSATAEPEHGDGLLGTPHPKLALLRSKDNKVTVARPVGEPVRAARLHVDGDRPQAEVSVHEGSPRRPDGRPTLTSFSLPWALLSFRDADTEALRRYCETAVWEYHDTATSHKLADGSIKTPPDEISQRSLAVEPVFFDEEAGRWTLRYRPDHVRLYGMPATVMTEQPRDPEQLYYPSVHTVACPAVPPRGGEARGVWLELSPGRVVEVGGRLLMGPGRLGLERLDWSMFGPGDQVHLEIVRGEITAPRRLRLVRWHPGPRSALLPVQAEARGGSGRTLLPVDQVDARRGGLRLGHGDYTLTYPVGPDSDRYQRGKPVMLNRSNELVRYDARRPLGEGDTALLGWFAGRLRILGRPGIQVRLAAMGGDLWPGAGWLHDALAGNEQAETVDALGGALPITLEEPDEDGTMVVSRRLQPTSALRRNGLLRLEAVAVLGSALVLRTGPALHLLAVRDVVPGVPDGSAAEVARALARTRRLVWLRVSGTASQPAKVDARLEFSAPLPYRDEFDAVPIAVVGSDAVPGGLLVHTAHDQGYRWLPTELLSWAAALTVTEISEVFLRSSRSLRVLLQRSGAVSALGVRRVWRARQDMALGDRLRVDPLELGVAADQSAPSSLQGDLAVAQPYGMLVRLVASASDRVYGEALSTEVAALGPGNTASVQVVPLGKRPLTLDLPQRVTSTSAVDAAVKHSEIADQHRRWLGEGWSGHTVLEHLERTEESAAAADAAVLRAWPGAVMEARRGPRDLAPEAVALHPRSLRALRQWLTVHGADAFGLRQEVELELAPSLAACLLMAHTGVEDQLLARGAVLLAHQIGLRASRSLHVEPVVRTWMAVAGAYQPDGVAARDVSSGPLDVRLAALRMPTTVDRSGLENILRFGHGVLGRVDAEAPAHRLNGTARAVLASVGQLSADMDLRADAATLSLVADLGRALHPPLEEAVAQPALEEPQTALLGAVLTRVVSEGPLSLLPVPARLPHPAERLAREVLQSNRQR